jgi:hypothetical protein
MVTIMYAAFLLLMGSSYTVCSVEGTPTLDHTGSKIPYITIADAHGKKTCISRDLAEKFGLYRDFLEDFGDTSYNPDDVASLPEGVTMAGFDRACEYVQKKTPAAVNAFLDGLITEKTSQASFNLKTWLKNFISRVIAACCFWRKTVPPEPIVWFKLHTFLKTVYALDALSADLAPLAHYFRRLVEQYQTYKAALIFKALNQDGRGRCVMDSLDRLNKSFISGNYTPFFTKNYQPIMHRDNCKRASTLGEFGIFIRKKDQNFVIISQTSARNQNRNAKCNMKAITRELINPIQLLSEQEKSKPKSLWFRVLHNIKRPK